MAGLMDRCIPNVLYIYIKKIKIKKNIKMQDFQHSSVGNEVGSQAICRSANLKQSGILDLGF